MFQRLPEGGQHTARRQAHPVKAYRTICSYRKLEGRVHKELAIGPILRCVYAQSNTHRGHGPSIEEGAES